MRRAVRHAAPSRSGDEAVDDPATAMSLVRLPARVLPSPRGRHEDRHTHLPALGFVVVYAALLLLVPSQLIVRQIGAPGTPANLWALACLVWWVCGTLNGQNRGGFTPTRLGIGLLSLCVVLSFAWASATGWWVPPSIRESTSDVTSLVAPTVKEITTTMSTAASRGLLSFAGWAGIVLLTTDGLRSWLDLRKLVGWLCWLGSVVAAVGVVQFFTTFDPVSYIQIPGLVANTDIGAVLARSVLNRVQGTAVHPIEFGVLMAALMPLALHYALHSGRGRRAWVPLLLIGVAIPMSVSRSAILASAVAFAVLLIGWEPRRRTAAVIILPVAVVALRLMIPGLVGTIRSLFSNFFNDPSITGRTDDYGVVFSLYSDHMWLGRGLFTFIPKYYRILDNQYLGTLLELGAVGLAALIAFFVLAYFAARGARRRALEPIGRDLSLSLSASIAGLVVSYVTFDAFSFPMAAGITFLLAGMAGAAYRVSRDANPTKAPTAVSHRPR